MIFGILDACRGCLGNLYLGGKWWGAVYESDYCLRMGLFTRDAFVLKTVAVYERDARPESGPVYESGGCPKSGACLRKARLSRK